MPPSSPASRCPPQAGAAPGERGTGRREQSGVVADRSLDRKSVPLLNDENKFKLAVFGVNVSGGCAMTTADGTIQVDWAESRRIAKAADAAGLDALVPVARW